MTFRELEIAEPILKAICEKGYEKPTPIQEKGIPVALGGGDMLGIAQTGTGKTATFAIPILQHLLADRSEENRSATRGNKGRLVKRRAIKADTDPGIGYPDRREYHGLREVHGD